MRAVDPAARRSTRARSLPLVLCSSLLTVGLLVAPTSAARDPEAAVGAFFDAVASRDLGDLDGIVCRAQQEALQDAFSDAGLGIELAADSLEGLTLRVDDLAVDVLTTDAQRVEAHVEATLEIEADAGELRDLARELIEAGADPDDALATDDDIEATLALMPELPGFVQSVDATVTLAVEEGEWVVCSGFGTTRMELDDAYDTGTVVSEEGLCALATPAELSALSALEYDSSTAFDEFCTYSRSDWDEYHAATVGLIAGSTLAEWREINGPGDELEIGGAAALASGTELFIQAGADVLQVSVSLPDVVPDDVDAVTQAAAIGELILPRLDQLEVTEIVTEPASAGPSLCQLVSTQELAEMAGRTFGEADGDPGYCTWSSSDPEVSLDMITATITDLTLDEFREILDGTEDGEIEGLASISTSNQAIVELPDGRSLDVSVFIDESAEPDLTPKQLAVTLAGWLATSIPAEIEAVDEGGLLAEGGSVDDICRAVPFEELSAISGVTFEDPVFGGDLCEYSGGDDTSGWHYALTSLDRLSLRDWLEAYPDASAVEIGGQAAMLATDPFGEGASSALAVVAVPGFDELTFSAYLAIDPGTSTEAATAAAVESIVEAGLARLLGGGD